MTTHSYSAVVDHTSDAGFRAWGSALAAALSTVGLVQTADTGQVNWGTVTRPGTNTVGGYEIWRFNDALQASAPIFLKVEYATGGGATAPQLWFTLATGSNGSGTLTGTSGSRTAVFTNVPPVSTVTPYNSRLCAKNGYFGLFFKIGSVTSAQAMGVFVCGRTSDTSGAETADGAYTISHSSSASNKRWQSLSFTAGTVFSQNAYGCLVAGDVTNSLVGTDAQIYKHYQPFPRMTSLLHVATAISTEITEGSTFSKALKGATARTYISGGGNVTGWSASGNAAHALCMLWE
jgi:hypothetical protein